MRMPTDPSYNFSLKDKIALITGASSGIGRHLAETLAASGARVIVTARRVERINKVQEELSKLGLEANAIPMDVTSRESVENALQKAKTTYGGIDILINNAGTASAAPFLEMTEDAWSDVIKTNLTGLWRVAQVTARLMAKQKSGSIINIASALGLAPQRNLSNYCAAKAGVIHLTRVMALELIDHGVRVNAIAPGYFETEMNDGFFATEQGKGYIGRLTPKRLGQLKELDGAALLLASDGGSFINGSVIEVDGGARLKSF